MARKICVKCPKLVNVHMTYSKPCDAPQHGVKLKGLLPGKTQSWCSCPT